MSESASCVERAMAVARRVHLDANWNGTDNYLDHLWRVAQRVRVVKWPDCEAVAWLHGSLGGFDHESNYTPEQLVDDGIPSRIIDAVKLFVRPAWRTYDDYIRRISGHELAREVKIADIMDKLVNARFTRTQLRNMASGLLILLDRATPQVPETL